MKLYNKGIREYHTADGDIIPGKTLEVSEKIGKTLLRNYPKDIVKFENIGISNNGIGEKEKIKEEKEKLRKEKEAFEKEKKLFEKEKTNNAKNKPVGRDNK